MKDFLKKYKNSPYHICYQTEDFDAAFTELTAGGFIAIAYNKILT